MLSISTTDFWIDTEHVMRRISMMPSFNRLSRDPAMHASINSIWIFTWRGHRVRLTTLHVQQSLQRYFYICFEIVNIHVAYLCWVLLLSSKVSRSTIAIDRRFFNQNFSFAFLLSFVDARETLRVKWCNILFVYIFIRARLACHPPADDVVDEDRR